MRVYKLLITTGSGLGTFFFNIIYYCIKAANGKVTVFQQEHITAIKDWAFK